MEDRENWKQTRDKKGEGWGGDEKGFSLCLQDIEPMSTGYWAYVYRILSICLQDIEPMSTGYWVYVYMILSLCLQDIEPIESMSTGYWAYVYSIPRPNGLIIATSPVSVTKAAPVSRAAPPSLLSSYSKLSVNFTHHSAAISFVYIVLCFQGSTVKTVAMETMV